MKTYYITDRLKLVTSINSLNSQKILNTLRCRDDIATSSNLKVEVKGSDQIQKTYIKLH